MKEGLKAGLTGEVKARVDEDMVIGFLGEGVTPVYSTPSMISHLEEAAWKTLKPYLDEGEESVGTEINIKHLAPTPIGMMITAQARLIKIDGRKCLFEVEAYDEKEKIGEGTHERFVIDVKRFASRVDSKKS